MPLAVAERCVAISEEGKKWLVARPIPVTTADLTSLQDELFHWIIPALKRRGEFCSPCCGAKTILISPYLGSASAYNLSVASHQPLLAFSPSTVLT
jgi:hypothetical protein